MSLETERKKIILAIDDSIINLRLLNVIISREGFEILTASNSLDAVPLAIQHEPDLILLDVMMPGINGLEILKILKQNALTQNIPVLMVTARTKGEDVKEALEKGAFDYVKKPLDEVEIMARIRSALRYKEYQDKLLELAMRDSLTGLYNHALLIDLLDKELYNSRRKKVPLVYVMVDIDHFKKVNDLHGHQAGDMILQQVSRILGQALRKGDPIGRYGGEEFGIILSGVGAAQAAILCDRIRATIQETSFVFDGKTIPITVSLGLAEALPEADGKPNDLVRLADEALYRAKHEGRNRLVVAS